MLLPSSTADRCCLCYARLSHYSRTQAVVVTQRVRASNRTLADCIRSYIDRDEPGPQDCRPKLVCSECARSLERLEQFDQKHRSVLANLAKKYEKTKRIIAQAVKRSGAQGRKQIPQWPRPPFKRRESKDEQPQSSSRRKPNTTQRRDSHVLPTNLPNRVLAASSPPPQPPPLLDLIYQPPPPQPPPTTNNLFVNNNNQSVMGLLLQSLQAAVQNSQPPPPPQLTPLESSGYLSQNSSFLTPTFSQTTQPAQPPREPPEFVSQGFKCKECEALFHRYDVFLNHNCDLCRKQPFECEECSKRFSQQGNLSCHMRIHTGDKPFFCEICKKPFRHSNSLRRHIRTVHAAAAGAQTKAGDDGTNVVEGGQQQLVAAVPTTTAAAPATTITAQTHNSVEVPDSGSPLSSLSVVVNGSHSATVQTARPNA